MTAASTRAFLKKLKWSRVEFKLESLLWRAAYRAEKRKPSSAPYLSGDGFRSLCSRFFEPETKQDFDPGEIREGDLVFCEAWNLPEFLSGPAVRAARRFSIISHNGDPNLDASVSRLIPPRVVKVFSQNALACDERVIGLPIGLENKRLHYNGITRDFNRLRQAAPKKLPRILSAFTVGNNQKVRQAASDALSSSRQNDFLSRTDSRSYRRIASRYMFIASPPGNGVDCHRTWEAMYLKSIPIVMRSSLMESFEKHGLPLFIVDSYSEVAGLTQNDLANIYSEMSSRFDSPALWFDYWANMIKKDAPCAH